jgi:hypothetical protein
MFDSTIPERHGLLGLTEQLFDVLLSAECLKDPAGGSHVVIRTYDLRPAIVSCAARAAGWHPAAGWQPACRHTVQPIDKAVLQL